MASEGTQPELGDLIEIFRFGYKHWAVYVGKGYVVHLDPSEVAGAVMSTIRYILADRAIVKKELLSLVSGGDKYRVNNKHDDKYEPWPCNKIIQQAEEMVGREVPYSVTHDNCEHFVNELRYRVSRSDQVTDAVIIFTVTATLMSVLGISKLIWMVLSGNKQKK